MECWKGMPKIFIFSGRKRFYQPARTCSGHDEFGRNFNRQVRRIIMGTQGRRNKGSSPLPSKIWVEIEANCLPLTLFQLGKDTFYHCDKCHLTKPNGQTKSN